MLFFEKMHGWAGETGQAGNHVSLCLREIKQKVL